MIHFLFWILVSSVTLKAWPWNENLHSDWGISAAACHSSQCIEKIQTQLSELKVPRTAVFNRGGVRTVAVFSGRDRVFSRFDETSKKLFETLTKGPSPSAFWIDFGFECPGSFGISLSEAVCSESEKIYTDLDRAHKNKTKVKKLYLDRSVSFDDMQKLLDLKELTEIQISQRLPVYRPFPLDEFPKLERLYLGDAGSLPSAVRIHRKLKSAVLKGSCGQYKGGTSDAVCIREIRSSFLKHVPNLEELDLTDNIIEKIPKDIGRAQKLKKLSLSEIRETELKKISGLGIEDLTMKNSSLKNISKDVSFLKKLKKLSVSVSAEGGASLSEFPIVSNGKIQELSLIGHYEIMKIPQNIHRMKHLRRLTVIDSDISEIPANISSLKFLEELEIGTVSGRRKKDRTLVLPVSLCSMKKLKRLRITGMRTDRETLRKLEDCLPKVRFDY
ncbi:MAG TPA: hypothetical protein PL169_18820 [Leptospiraceae bacterium]|nr:hypothetical protein [Leptospiraceae bacterium]